MNQRMNKATRWEGRCFSIKTSLWVCEDSFLGFCDPIPSDICYRLSIFAFCHKIGKIYHIALQIFFLKLCRYAQKHKHSFQQHVIRLYSMLSDYSSGLLDYIACYQIITACYQIIALLCCGFSLGVELEISTSTIIEGLTTTQWVVSRILAKLEHYKEIRLECKHQIYKGIGVDGKYICTIHSLQWFLIIFDKVFQAM